MMSFSSGRESPRNNADWLLLIVVGVLVLAALTHQQEGAPKGDLERPAKLQDRLTDSPKLWLVGQWPRGV